MANQARKRLRVDVRKALQDVRGGIITVMQHELDQAEIPADEEKIATLGKAAIGVANLIGSVASNLERLADAKEQEAQALEHQASGLDRAKKSE